MVSEKFEVDLARLDLRRQSIGSKFCADSHGGFRLYIVANLIGIATLLLRNYLSQLN
jgi:hypothetical protein